MTDAGPPFHMIFSTSGEEEPYLEPDLEEKELTAIGYVTAQWAFLEHALLMHTLELTQSANAPLPTDATSLSFTKRLRAWRLSVEQFVTDDKEKKRFLDLVGSIANAEDQRHKVAHGLWDWDYGNPDQLTAFSFRPRVQFERPFDLGTLFELARKIGRINFQIQYPGGKDQALEALLERGASVSRSFARSVMGIAQPDQDRPQASPLEHKPPRWSSKE